MSAGLFRPGAFCIGGIVAASCWAVPAAADPNVQIVQQAANSERVPDEPSVATKPAASSTKLPWRMVSLPQGIERVIDPTPTPSSARVARAAAPAFRSTFNNGVAEQMAPGQTDAAQASTNRAAFVEDALPNGARRLSPPVATSAPTGTQAAAFPIVDVDAAGHTERPADAARMDVLLRRVPVR